jgi:RNA polymerase sigma-70 factor, ECF subfamily
MVHRAREPLPSEYRALERVADDDVMAALQAGSHDAVAVLFERYHRLVYAIARRILRDAGEAEDVTQVVFLDLFRGAAQFDPAKGTTKMWLLQYAYHRALSRKRYLNVRSFYGWETLDQAAGLASSGDGRAVRSAPIEVRDLIEKGLASLTEAQRTVIEGATFDGLSMKELAMKTSDSLVNVRHHYYRGLRKLRGFVEQHSILQNAVGDD